MKGCILFGRFTFSTETKNRSPRQARRAPAKTGTRSSAGEKS
jgi:hypothetical protein